MIWKFIKRLTEALALITALTAFGTGIYYICTFIGSTMASNERSLPDHESIIVLIQKQDEIAFEVHQIYKHILGTK